MKLVDYYGQKKLECCVQGTNKNEQIKELSYQG